MQFKLELLIHIIPVFLLVLYHLPANTSTGVKFESADFTITTEHTLKLPVHVWSLLERVCVMGYIVGKGKIELFPDPSMKSFTIKQTLLLSRETLHHQAPISQHFLIHSLTLIHLLLFEWPQLKARMPNSTLLSLL